MLCEIHSHSKYSDGMPSVEKMLEKASRLGAFAITDHNTLKGYEHAKKFMQNNIENRFDFILIPGTEITAVSSSNKQCHVLGLGIEELKKSIPLSTVENVIDYIHSQGGIAIAAHPFRQRQSVDKNDAKIFDALEVINGNTFPESNEKARKLAVELKKPMTSGSDAHLAMDIGRFAFSVDGDNIDKILENIKKGKITLPDKIPGRLHLFTRKTGGKAFRKITKYKRNY